MLSNEAMGVLALAILWVNALLVAGAAYQELRELGDRRARLGPRPGAETTLLRGRVVRGAGPDGALAEHRVEQIGRAGGGGSRPSILFADRSAVGKAFGGAVALADGSEVAVDPSDSAEVWLAPAELARAAACASDEVFDEAYQDARKARGFSRVVHARIGEGAEVFLLGHLRQKGETPTLTPAADGGLLVSTLDPAGFCARKSALIVGAIAGDLAAAAGCTLLALHLPRFGTVSLVGAALGLAFFLLVQPLGTAVRDAVKTPARAALRGAWLRREKLDPKAPRAPAAKGSRRGPVAAAP